MVMQSRRLCLARLPWLPSCAGSRFFLEVEGKRVNKDRGSSSLDFDAFVLQVNVDGAYLIRVAELDSKLVGPSSRGGNIGPPLSCEEFPSLFPLGDVDLGVVAYVLNESGEPVVVVALFSGVHLYGDLS